MCKLVYHVHLSYSVRSFATHEHQTVADMNLLYDDNTITNTDIKSTLFQERESLLNICIYAILPTTCEPEMTIPSKRVECTCVI